ncbi:S8 family peptidase [Dactylosporangium sp. NPDC051541]|uniref:S8 family peptidase n=1 Tax=Dactylosporangium sp. NPDC051541 TaxID=3363977 RepID=UPI003797A2B5
MDDVRVAVSEQLEHWAQWYAQGHPEELGAVGPDPRRAAYFVADEMLVDTSDRDSIAELVADFGAEVLPEPPVPPPPPAIAAIARHRRIRSFDEMPGVVRLRFADPPRLDGAARELAEAYARHTPERGEIAASSERAMRMAALAARYSDRPTVGLNIVGTTCAMPLAPITEAPGFDPVQWWTTNARRVRLPQAWLLADSIRRIRGRGPMVILAVCDGGFWLDEYGVPRGQPSDLGTGVMQMDLMSEFAAMLQIDQKNVNGTVGGRNPNKCSGGSVCPWHGNAVASVAAGIVNNKTGIAGAAGDTALPYLFRTNISAAQLMYCAKTCAAWGIDVLNMSIEFTYTPEILFGHGSWDSVFQFAADNGVVMVAAAGNDNHNLPYEDNPRPATRTPGVLAVGALDANGVKPAGFSNYGPSVNLWAPGVGIPVPPDGDVPSNHTEDGTSVASPVVAGVAAMMRWANPALTSQQVRQILLDTAWVGESAATRCLDAYAALGKAVGYHIADSGEPNNTPGSARALISQPDGTLVPSTINPFTAISASNDVDYWTFTLGQFSNVAISLDYYQMLVNLKIAVEPVARTSRTPDKLLTWTGTPGAVRLNGVLAPGQYRIRVDGPGMTAYALAVKTTPAPLRPDRFEANDSFDNAAIMRFSGKATLISWAPGSYEATLHANVFGDVNQDYYRLDTGPSVALSHPRVTADFADFPVDVHLYDSARKELKIWSRTLDWSQALEPATHYYLRVNGQQPTRYRLTTAMATNDGALLGPRQVPRLIPHWWIDPAPYLVDDPMQVYGIHVGDSEIAFGGAVDGVRLELLSPAGEPLRQSTVDEGRLTLDTSTIPAGLYALRVTRVSEAAATIHRLPPR